MYPETKADYESFKSVREQTDILNRLFPHLRLGIPSAKASLQALPEGAKAQVVIPRWQLFDTSYPYALEMVISKLKQVRGKHLFYNALTGWPHGSTTPFDDSFIRVGTRHEAMFDLLVRQQSKKDTTCNLVVVPVQFGRRLGSSSVTMFEQRLAHSSSQNEFCLSTFDMLIMFLVQPEWFLDQAELGQIFCPGDECDYKLTKIWNQVPFFEIKAHSLTIKRAGVDYTPPLYAPIRFATGFLNA